MRFILWEHTPGKGKIKEPLTLRLHCLLFRNCRSFLFAWRCPFRHHKCCYFCCCCKNQTKPKADLLSSEKSPAAHVRRLVQRPLVAASGTWSGMPAASSDWGLKASLATGSGSLRASPGMRSYTVKLDEEKSKHVGLAQENGFGSA